MRQTVLAWTAVAAVGTVIVVAGLMAPSLGLMAQEKAFDKAASVYETKDVSTPTKEAGAPVRVTKTAVMPSPTGRAFDPATSSVTLEEIFRLKALKKRIGGENLKKLIDALAD